MSLLMEVGLQMLMKKPILTCEAVVVLREVRIYSLTTLVGGGLKTLRIPELDVH